jgi:hypothetical protein
MGKLQSSSRVGFPEINARPEPIVFVVAGLKGFAAEQALTHTAAAAVIAENEGGGETMQGLAVVFGQFT